MTRLIFEQPKRVAEANVVGELYHQLRLSGLDCYLDYHLDHCRFDAVIIEEGFIVAIIEVKNWSKPHSADKIRATKQYQKYSAFGVPLFWVGTLEDVPKRVRELKEWRLSES